MFLRLVKLGQKKSNTISNHDNGNNHNNHNDNDNCSSHFFPSSASTDIDIKIKDEGYFRSFDLVIAVIDKRRSGKSNIIYDSIESYDNYLNILMRSGILTQFAKSEKCRI